MARIRKHDRKRAEKRAKGRAHSENKETTSTFGNDEHIRKPRKPRIDEHIRKRVEKRAKGPDRRTQYDIYVTVIFRSYRKLEGKVSPEIRPVNKWNKFTAIKIQGGCPGGTGTDLGFHIICQDNNRNHLDERVHLLIKCPDCPNCHCFLKIKGWVDEETSIPMNCRTKIGKIECSGFEPIGGVGMLEFMDDFSVHSTCGESVGLMIRLGQRVDVVVNGPHGHIALGEIIGINVDYERQSC